MNRMEAACIGKRCGRAVWIGALAVGAIAGAGWAAHQQPPGEGYRDTPFLPGGKWRVHDADRPRPPVVAPGTCSTQETPGRAPSDAVVLFDGHDLSRWRDAGGGPTGWKVVDGAMVVPPAGTPGGGVIFSREEFGDCQLHVEWATPKEVKGKGQGRGNSGVFLFGLYEIQVLDSYENPTYADGQAGSVYGQAPPMVNASLPPAEWQAYDILFTAPRFKDNQLLTPAYFTVLHNGVAVQNHAEVLGPMAHRQLPKYTPHGERGPISFQDHSNPVRYRNVWVRALKSPA